jgi:hypothetical protein
MPTCMAVMRARQTTSFVLTIATDSGLNAPTTPQWARSQSVPMAARLAAVSKHVYLFSERELVLRLFVEWSLASLSYKQPLHTYRTEFLNTQVTRMEVVAMATMPGAAVRTAQEAGAYHAQRLSQAMMSG